MTAPNEVVGEAVVKVRACNRLDTTIVDGLWKEVVPCLHWGDHDCPGCQGNGTYLDTTEATEVEAMRNVKRVVARQTFTVAERVPSELAQFWRPVEKGDSDG